MEYTKNLHRNELAALTRAAEKHGGFNKILPCPMCGKMFDRKSIISCTMQRGIVRFIVYNDKKYEYYNDY